jgi:hypothetical protein
MPAASDGKTKRDRDGAVGLRYVGDGSGFPDIPARDLTDDDLRAVLPYVLAWSAGASDAPVMTLAGLRKLLLSSGLYVEASVPAAPEISEG